MFMVKLFSLQQEIFLFVIGILHPYCITSVDHIDSIRHIGLPLVEVGIVRRHFFAPFLLLTHPCGHNGLEVIVGCPGIISCVLDACGSLTDMNVIYHSSFTHLDSGYRQIILSIRSTLLPRDGEINDRKVRDLGISSLPTLTPVPPMDTFSTPRSLLTQRLHS